MKRLKTYHLLIFPVAIGIIVYFVGNKWGLPLRLHPNEGTIVNEALRMAREKSFTPTAFSNPDHLPLLIYSFFYRFYANADPNGDWPITVVRNLSALFSIGCILLAYRLGKKNGERAGLITAFLFALFPIYVTHSHYAVTDMLVVFLMLLLLWASMAYLEKPTHAKLLLTSLVAAAFTASRYAGVVLIVMLVVNVLLVKLPRKESVAAAAYGLAAVGLGISFTFFLAPNLLVEFEKVQKAIEYETRTTHLGADGLGWWGNMLYYFHEYMKAGGVFLLLFFLIGTVWLVRNRKTHLFLAPCFYPLVYWIAISRVPLHWERWGLPMYVAPLLVSAIGIDRAIDYLVRNKGSRKLRGRVASIATVLSLIIITANLASGVGARLVVFLVPDTRVQSQMYSKLTGMNKENTAYEGYTPLAPSGPKSIINEFECVGGDAYLKDEKKKYVILSSTMYDRYKKEPEKYPEQNELYQAIERDYELMNEYKPASTREATSFDFINIYKNIKYIIRMKGKSLSGPSLLFYQAKPDNYWIDSEQAEDLESIE